MSEMSWSKNVKAGLIHLDKSATWHRSEWIDVSCVGWICGWKGWLQLLLDTPMEFRECWERRRSIGSERTSSSYLDFVDCLDQSIDTKDRFSFLDKFGCVNVTQIGETTRDGANLFSVAFKNEVLHVTKQIGQFYRWHRWQFDHSVEMELWQEVSQTRCYSQNVDHSNGMILWIQSCQCFVQMLWILAQDIGMLNTVFFKLFKWIFK